MPLTAQAVTDEFGMFFQHSFFKVEINYAENQIRYDSETGEYAHRVSNFHNRPKFVWPEELNTWLY